MLLSSPSSPVEAFTSRFDMKWMVGWALSLATDLSKICDLSQVTLSPHTLTWNRVHIPNLSDFHIPNLPEESKSCGISSLKFPLQIQSAWEFCLMLTQASSTVHSNSSLKVEAQTASLSGSVALGPGPAGSWEILAESYLKVQTS